MYYSWMNQSKFIDLFKNVKNIYNYLLLLQNETNKIKNLSKLNNLDEETNKYLNKIFRRPKNNFSHSKLSRPNSYRSIKEINTDNKKVYNKSYSKENYNNSTNTNTYHSNASNSIIVNNKIINNNIDNNIKINKSNKKERIYSLNNIEHQKSFYQNNNFNKSHKKNLTSLDYNYNINNYNNINKNKKKIINSKSKKIPLKNVNKYIMNNLNRQNSYLLLKNNSFITKNNLKDNKNILKKSKSKNFIPVKNLFKENNNNKNIDYNSIKDKIIKKYIVYIQKIIRGYLFRKNNFYRMKLKMKEISVKNKNNNKKKTNNNIIDLITKIKYKSRRVQTPTNSRTNTTINRSFINLNNNNSNIEKIISQNKIRNINDKSYCESYSQTNKKIREYDNELNKNFIID